MRRLNSSILCKEHRVYDVNKEKPIARYGRPICEMLLRKLDVEDVFDSHCVDYETLGVDFVEDNKSEGFGNWNFNQLEML